MALSIILHRDFYVKHFKSKSLLTIEYYGTYQNSGLFSSKKIQFSSTVILLIFQKLQIGDKC